MGDKEAAEGTISVRDRSTDQTRGDTVSSFVQRVRQEIIQWSR